jgi:hypothetical protein
MKFTPVSLPLPLQPGESPEEALRRIDRLPGPEGAAVLESEAGQALLRACAVRAKAARRAVRDLTGERL